MRKNRMFMTLCALEMMVLLLAASGILALD
jgi:hypothetical protein